MTITVHHGIVSVGFIVDPPLVLLQTEDHMGHVDVAMTPEQAMALAEELMEKAERAKHEAKSS